MTATSGKPVEKGLTRRAIAGMFWTLSGTGLQGVVHSLDLGGPGYHDDVQRRRLGLAGIDLRVGLPSPEHQPTPASASASTGSDPLRSARP